MIYINAANSKVKSRFDTDSNQIINIFYDNSCLNYWKYLFSIDHFDANRNVIVLRWIFLVILLRVTEDSLLYIPRVKLSRLHPKWLDSFWRFLIELISYLWQLRNIEDILIILSSTFKIFSDTIFTWYIWKSKDDDIIQINVRNPNDIFVSFGLLSSSHSTHDTTFYIE